MEDVFTFLRLIPKGYDIKIPLNNLEGIDPHWYKVISAIGRGMPYVGSRNWLEYVRPSNREWHKIWMKFMKAKPTQEMIETFTRINDIPPAATEIKEK